MPPCKTKPLSGNQNIKKGQSYFRPVLIILLICVYSTSRAQVNIITRIAGTGFAGYSNGYPATNAQFNRPNAICIDKSNNIYSTDAFNHRIRKISLSTNTVTTYAGNGIATFAGDSAQATNASLYVPQGINIDKLGNIYIADGGNQRIRKIDTSGIITTIAGTGVAGHTDEGDLAINAEINNPGGVFVYKDSLYITDCDNNRVRRIDLITGKIKTVAGNGIAGYSGDGGQATSAQLYGPVDVICDAVGNIYIAEQWNNVIRKVDIATGIITTIAGNGIVGYWGDNGLAVNSQMNEPTGLFFDNKNNLFISDYRNGAIRKINANDGKITTVAGGAVGFSGDGGPAINAKLKCTDVWVDEYDNIYIADYVNDCIRKVNNAVAINDINREELENKLYPNPTTDGIITVQSRVNIDHICVCDISGMKIYDNPCTTSIAEVDISDQPPGLYIVYVRCGDKQYISKIVKE